MVEVGAVNAKRPNRLHNGQIGHFRRHGVEPKMYTTEFKVTEDAVLPGGKSFLRFFFFCPRFYFYFCGFIRERLFVVYISFGFIDSLP